MAHKVFKDAGAALEGVVFDGMTVMSGGAFQPAELNRVPTARSPSHESVTGPSSP